MQLSYLDTSPRNSNVVRTGGMFGHGEQILHLRRLSHFDREDLEESLSMPVEKKWQSETVKLI
jgi:hypothetical protein